MLNCGDGLKESWGFQMDSEEFITESSGCDSPDSPLAENLPVVNANWIPDLQVEDLRISGTVRYKGRWHKRLCNWIKRFFKRKGD